MPPMDRLEIAKGVEATRDFALLLRDERALVISDLHLGFEGALAEQGVSIPRFQRRVILERLGQMFDRTKAEQVIIAGDFKHEFSKNLVDEWVEVKQVLRFIRDRAKPVLVRGNHDNYLATILGDLNLPLNARADVGGYTIVHGHEEVSTLHVAADIGLGKDDLVLKSESIAKVRLAAVDRARKARQGKLVLVTGTTPTRYGEGKTLTTVGLGQALNRLGKKGIVAVREPSL